MYEHISRLVISAIVVRVLPRTFRSITDLLLARSLMRCKTRQVPLRRYEALGCLPKVVPESELRPK